MNALVRFRDIIETLSRCFRDLIETFSRLSSYPHPYPILLPSTLHTALHLLSHTLPPSSFRQPSQTSTTHSLFTIDYSLLAFLPKQFYLHVAENHQISLHYSLIHSSRPTSTFFNLLLVLQATLASACVSCFIRIFHPDI